MIPGASNAIAYVDEASARLDDGQRAYALGAVLISVEDHETCTRGLLPLLMPGRTYLHHYDETPARRLMIAGALATLPLRGAIVATTVTVNADQEKARVRLLTHVLPRLEHCERIDRVVLESRGRGDKHDLRTHDKLRRSRNLQGLQIDHRRKDAEPMTWVADFVVSAYMAAQHRSEGGPWKLINEAHVIDMAII